MNRHTQKIKFMLTAIMLVMLAGVIWAFSQYRRQQNAIQIPLPKAAAKAVMALSQVRQTATKDGTLQWELEAAGAELEANTGRMVLESPRVDFFLENGSRVHLTAKQGILFTKTNDIEVNGNVQVHSDRYSLTTEAMAYQHDHRVLHTRAKVQIIGQDFDLTAATMTYDLKINQAHFDGHVKGIIHDISAL